ncbi:hypothetical protein D1781_16260 [Amnibacterium setariae]|uniref:Uncharacterized protein n=2 Tax=Amnibacterium setariae TaxID=2306585 RepID=A0A3A1TWH4_9MICO|nr:hypothetical protein D1781_16260 [Amnibacterium setariae]
MRSVRLMPETFDAEQVILEVTGTLLSKFPDKDPADVERAVREQVEDLQRRPVRDYVSVLARRAAKKQLESKD